MDDSKQLVEAWTEYQNEPGCIICFSEDITHKIETKCKHIFCYDCLKEWLKISDTCPLCRETSPEKKPTKLLDIKFKKFLGSFVDLVGLKNRLKIVLFRRKNCYLKIQGEKLYVKTSCGYNLLNTNFWNIRCVKSDDNKISIEYIVMPTKSFFCRHKSETRKDCTITFDMDNDEQRKELVESITEWFEAGVVHIEKSRTKVPN